VSGFSRTILVLILASAFGLTPRAQTGTAGMRDPAWSPDGKRLAAVVLDRIWIMQADGRDATEFTKGPAPPVPSERPRAEGSERSESRGPGSEREPIWSPDGKRIAFVSDHGDGFDLYVAGTRGGTPERVVLLDGDERSPSWTPDGRLVFAHRA
jgi:Tol biopolymer transport system component